MNAIKDTAKAKLMRAAMAGDRARFLTTRFPSSMLESAAGQDVRLARLLSFDLWWPQFCERPVKLRFFFIDLELIVSRIVSGYLYLDDPVSPSEVYVQPEPAPELIPDQAVPFPGRLGRLETADEGEGGLLWLQDTVVPETREEQLALLESGENHGGVLFPPSTPPAVRDYLLNPIWWPLHSSPEAVRIAVRLVSSYEPSRGYLGRDGAGFIYLLDRMELSDYVFLDVREIKGLAPSNRSKYRKLGKIGS